MPAGIYAIINILNEKVYIGSSIDISNRLRIHFYELKFNKHSNSKLQNSFNLHGKNNFIAFTVEEVFIGSKLKTGHNFLTEKEKYWIDFYKEKYGREHLYNIILDPVYPPLLSNKNRIYKTGPENPLFGRKRDPEVIRRMSETKRGVPSKMKGKKNPSYGWKVSLAKKGKPWNKKQRESQQHRIGIPAHNIVPLIATKISTGEIYEFISLKEAADKLNLKSIGNISSCLHGKLRHYFGYTFELKKIT